MPCRDIYCSCPESAAYRLSLSAAQVTVIHADAPDPTPPDTEAEAPDTEAEEWTCPSCGDTPGGTGDDYPRCGNCGNRVGCCCACSVCEARGCSTRFFVTDGSGCANDGDCGDRCSIHCRCNYCRGCSTHRYDRSLCERCDYCFDSGCCECPRCEGCEETVGSTCDDCDRCDTCCDCREASEDPDENSRTSGSSSRPRFVDRGLVFHRGFKHPRFPSLRYAAAEIEVAAAGSGIAGDFDAAAQRWSASVVSDGSLPSTGFEINTAPASGTKFVEQIEELCGILNRYDASVTTACGLHVHLDFRHASTTDVAKATMLAYAIENALMTLVPASRRDLHFCKSLGTVFGRIGTRIKGADTFAARFSAIGEMVYGTTDHDSIRYGGRSKYNPVRYSWWNVHSWFHRKTIEVRLHGGTTNSSKIIMWASFFAALLDRAQRMSIDDVEAFVAGGDSWVTLLALCPTEGHVRYFAERRSTFNRYYNWGGDPAVSAALASFNTNTAAVAAQE